jgi:hypothetical protein
MTGLLTPSDDLGKMYCGAPWAERANQWMNAIAERNLPKEVLPEISKG